MTSTAQRSDTNTWSKVFPCSIDTKKKTSILVKSLLGISASNILYVRKILPENQFTTKNIDEIEIKLLKDSSPSSSGSRIVQWLKGAFDAIEKQYLKTAIFVLHRGEKNFENVVETYNFKFKYDKNGANMQLNREQDGNSKEIFTIDTVKSEVFSLLEKIKVLENGLDPINENLSLSMKLSFYTGITPENYIAPGFSRRDNLEINYSDDVKLISLGGVHTNYNEVEISVKSTKLQDQILRDVEIDQDVCVDCPCENNIDLDLMIMCEACKNWQHAVCYGIFEIKLDFYSHLCHKCSNDKSFEGLLDKNFEGLSESGIKKICFFRQALNLCLKNEIMSTEILMREMRIDEVDAKNIFQRLIKEKALENKPIKKIQKKVDREYIINELIPIYFRVISKVNNCNKRAFNEVENSQESFLDSMCSSSKQICNVINTPLKI